MEITEQEMAEFAVTDLLYFIGEDPAREGLLDTPKRVVKAWREMTIGYAQDPRTVLGTSFGKEKYDQMILSEPIPFVSVCEHHMLPFTGFAYVGYVPRDRVVGLSKMARLVDCYARRLQIQERLTQQIADTMFSVLKPLGVGVLVNASHSCMSCRGVMKTGTTMTTCALKGVFKKKDVKEEFFLHCYK